jgi:1,4-alpha-glucan branching enzyme
MPSRAIEVAPPGILAIPAPGAAKVEIRFSPISARDHFDPAAWNRQTLQPQADAPAMYQIDVNALELADGTYEYEYLIDDVPVADPFAEELVRFGGYRTVFHIRDGRRTTTPFAWDEELPEGVRLANNDELVLYELPLRWMSAGPAPRRGMMLGTLEKTIFERLHDFSELGINALVLLPIQDSPDTLNSGYGTRFFFAPDIDAGAPVDMKLLVKLCHQRGIRVILDLVMSHSRECPLEKLAPESYYLNPGEENGRNPQGGRLFRYSTPVNDSYPAREFQYQAGSFWIREYHIDGFRVTGFNNIDNWEFVQAFAERTTETHQDIFPGRPFLVIAEDSQGRAEITQDHPQNPQARRLVDAVTNVTLQSELRQLLTDRLCTFPGQPSRTDRIRSMISGERLWDSRRGAYREGFTDTIQAVNYLTSHDVAQEDKARLMNFLLADSLRRRGLLELEENAANVVNQLAQRGLLDRNELRMNLMKQIVGTDGAQPPEFQAAREEALERVAGAFALLATSSGLPMFLAGEEFGDIHDLPWGDSRLEMSDPVDWTRRDLPGHQTLMARVREFINLRTSHPALRQNEIEFFYFHPSLDENDGARVFAYCRTGGQPLGSAGQVVVLANCGPQDYSTFEIPWLWSNLESVKEHGVSLREGASQFLADEQRMILSLAPFQVRLFTT